MIRVEPLLAIIPARGGSKGVPRKNLRVVGDRSLLVRAIDSARGVPGIGTVLVSTDDAEIADAARAAGASVPFLRPAALAGDLAPTLPVVRHALDWARSNGMRPPAIVLLEPTSPFRTTALVAAAVERFAAGDCRSVVSVVPLERKPENIFVAGRHLERYIRDPVRRHARRQDMADLRRIDSAVYVCAADAVDAGELMAEPIGYVEGDWLSAINIDTPLDLDFARFLSREREI